MCALKKYPLGSLNNDALIKTDQMHQDISFQLFYEALWWNWDLPHEAKDILQRES